MRITLRLNLLLLATSLWSLPSWAATNVVLAFGTTYAGMIGEPGEGDWFTFTAVPGQRIYLLRRLGFGL